MGVPRSSSDQWSLINVLQGGVFPKNNTVLIIDAEHMDLLEPLKVLLAGNYSDVNPKEVDSTSFWPPSPSPPPSPLHHTSPLYGSVQP